MKSNPPVWAWAGLFILGLSAAVPAYAGGLPSPPPGFERIDAHVHIYQADPAYRDMLNRLSLRVLNICVADNFNPQFPKVARQHAAVKEVFDLTGGRAAWCSTFDTADWEQKGFAERANRDLKATFKQGAVAVKIYKDIGMLLKSKDGKDLMPDDPVFDPIFACIAANHRTVLAHIAEPSSCWRALDSNTLHYGSWKAHPSEHMYLHPERPSKETILVARDRMLQNHPNLRFIGCHLGSLEDDVDQLAKRLDLYSNFAVDTAARVPDLMNQDSGKVRAFLIKYQDRVLYGTDLILMEKDDPVKSIGKMEATYARDWQYLATGETIKYRKLTTKGLALPESVLKKIFHENAVKWVPGLIPTKSPKELAPL